MKQKPEESRGIADEDRVGNKLLQILKLRFGQKAKLLFRKGLVKILKLKFRQDLQLEFGHLSSLIFYRGYEVESWSRFEARFGQDFEVLWRG